MEDYIGRQFGRLTVIELTDPTIDKHGKKRTTYICKCSCGVSRNVTRHQLQIKNGTKSCGCLDREARSKLGLSKRKYHPREGTAREIYLFRYNDGDLTFEDFLNLSQLNCHYCNSKPTASYNKYAFRKNCKVSEFAIAEGNFIYNGLDRLDSSLPHDKTNVVPCCYRCNRAKSDTHVDDFREWIRCVYENWAKERAR